MKRIKFTSFILPVCWLIISTILLTLPGTAFPQENWLDKIWADKWIHIAMFSIMVFLWCRAFRNTSPDKTKLRKIFYWVALTWFLYGIGMEFVQKYLVPFRSFDVGDIIADGLGSLLGLIFSTRTYLKK